MKDGEIVRYDFEVYAEDVLIDTSIEDLAREHGIGDEDTTYAPRYAIVGMDGLYPGIREALMEASEGETGEATATGAKAFGDRNQRDVVYKRYTDIARIASQQEKDVDRGVRLDIDGRIATITLVTPSRVRIDFNHEHAGKVIRSKVHVVEVITGQDDIIRAILEINMNSSEGFEFSVEDDILTMKVPSPVSLDPAWSSLKLRVVTQLRRYSGIRNIRYVEEFFQKTEVFPEPEVSVTTDQPTSVESPEDTASDIPSGDPASEVSPEDPASEVSPEDPASEVSPEDPASEVSPEDPASEVSPEDPASEVSPEDPASEV